MIDLGGKAAITDVGTMVFLPSTQPKLTLGDQEYLRSGVIAPSATYPDFPFVDGRYDIAYKTHVIPSTYDDEYIKCAESFGDTTVLICFDKVTSKVVAYISRDNCTTWQKLSLPAPLSITGGNVRLAVSKTGMWFITNGSKIWRSVDLSSWSECTPAGMSAAVACAALFALNGRVVYFSDEAYPIIRCYYTNNNGAAWTKYDLSGEASLPIRPELMVVDDNRAIMCGSGGYYINQVCATTDGINWIRSTFGSQKYRGGAVVSGTYITYDDQTGDVKRSTDGINWTTDTSLRTIIGGFAGQFRLIQLPGAAALVTLTLTTVYMTTDGETWRLQPASTQGFGLSYYNNYLRGTQHHGLLGIHAGAVLSAAMEQNQYIGAQTYTPNLYLRVK